MVVLICACGGGGGGVEPDYALSNLSHILFPVPFGTTRYEKTDISDKTKTV